MATRVWATSSDEQHFGIVIQPIEEPIKGFCHHRDQLNTCNTHLCCALQIVYVGNRHVPLLIYVGNRHVPLLIYVGNRHVPLLIYVGNRHVPLLIYVGKRYDMGSSIIFTT